MKNIRTTRFSVFCAAAFAVACSLQSYASASATEMRLSSFSPHADGVKDDTPALTELFKAAAKAKCRKVVIEPGVYLVEAKTPIPLYGGTFVVAEGAEFRFPRKLGGAHRTMFRGMDITDFKWRGGFFRGYVYDPERKDNDWEPHASSRGIVIATSANGRTKNISISEVCGDGLCGAAITISGHYRKSPYSMNMAENIDVKDCSLERCGKFMWDYGFLWERRKYPDLFDADQVALAKKYDDLSSPVAKSYWQWGPRGGGPGKGGIDIVASRNVIVSGCRMHACGDAMHIYRSHNVVFTGNQITGARMGAFFIAHFCKNVTITGNTVDGTNGSRVMSVEKCTEDITIIGNTFLNGGRGSWINQPKNIIIANNIFCSNTLKGTPEIGKGRLTYHGERKFERYPEIYFTCSYHETYGPVIMTGNIFELSKDTSLAVAFRNGGEGIIFEDNVYRGVKRDFYVGPYCEMPRMNGNVGLGNVVRELGDAQSGGGAYGDVWSAPPKGWKK